MLQIQCQLQIITVDAGDEVEVDFDSGMIYNKTKGTQFQGQAFPEFMQKIIDQGGLVKYVSAQFEGKQ